MKDGELSKQDKKLIRYLAEHNHWSPFSHPQIQLRYTVPIFVARQEFKHQIGFARNEVSRRYVDSSPVFYSPDEWRGKPVNKKQGSSDVVITEIDFGRDEIRNVDELVEGHYRSSLYLYEKMVAGGIAAEQARMVLPQAMYTSYYITGSLAAFARMFGLRAKADAQKEIQVLADMVGEIIAPLYPVSWTTLTKNA